METNIQSPSQEEIRKFKVVLWVLVVLVVSGALHVVRMIIDVVLFCASHVRIV